jgi:hypothetical protein
MLVGNTACGDYFEHFRQKVITRFVDVSGPCSEYRSGPEPYQTWVPFWPIGPRRGCLNSGYLRSHTRVHASPQQTSRLLPGPTGRSLVQTDLQSYRPGLPLSRSLRELVLPALARGEGEGTGITLFVNFHSDGSSLSKDSSVSLHSSFLHPFSG